MLRRLHPEQPDSFAFTPANKEWAEAQMTKFPEGRQASAVIPLLWRAQEQEGWVTKPAIEHIADMLGMAYIRVLEVATFYFMFQLQPVGSVAHVQVCGTTSCMICGAEDLIGVCKEKIAPRAHELSEDGRFSWEEVECLGACANAPMVQIGKDFYEDLTTERFAEILDAFAAGEVPTPGPQNGRFAAEPAGGVTSLTDHAAGKPAHNASAARAVELGDTVKRIDGTEVPILTPWLDRTDKGADTTRRADEDPAAQDPAVDPAEIAALRAKEEHGRPDEDIAKAPTGAAKPGPRDPEEQSGREAVEKGTAPAMEARAPAPEGDGGGEESAPETLDGPRDGGADDLKRIKGVGPKLEGVLNDMGFWHFDQIANWSRAEVNWVDARLKFKGRIDRDDWIGQAQALAAEKDG